jgi:subtilase family serine protease
VTRRRRLFVATLVSLLVGGGGLVPALTSTSTAAPNLVNYVRSCPAYPPVGYATCDALRRTDIAARTATPNAGPNALTPSGYTPADLQSAYKLPSATKGAGHTIAIVDAWDDPNAELDLGTYRQTFNLPSCTSLNGCFRKVNQTGGVIPPPPNANWSDEVSLDLDMASASCPKCKILLVEADDGHFTNMEVGIRTAASLGADVISLSWGSGPGYDPPDVADSPYHQPGIPVVASSGDLGYGIQYPANSRYVYAVGGTSLFHASNARGWSETAWSGGGSGCSHTNPAIAPPKMNTGCAGRAETDLSAIGNPNTGVSVYNTFGGTGWEVFGGTSASAPIIAGAIAMLADPTQIANPAILYFVPASFFFDVTSGSNGSCTVPQRCQARVGWDGPTGRGTPNLTLAS